MKETVVEAVTLCAFLSSTQQSTICTAALFASDGPAALSLQSEASSAEGLVTHGL